MESIRVQLSNALKRQLESKYSDDFLEKLSQQCLKIIRDRVPIDTKQLRDEGITVTHYKQGDNYVIDMFVNNLPHDQARTLSMGALGLILNLSDRRRSQSQPKNPAGSTTAGWWDEAIQDIKDLIVD